MGGAIGLRRFYRRHLGSHGRFHLAVAVTILAVAYLLVPAVAQFVVAAGGYQPTGYEPKDVARATWLASRPPALGGITVGTLVNVGLILLAVGLWVSVLGTRRR